jgi:hypothetical protein
MMRASAVLIVGCTDREDAGESGSASLLQAKLKVQKDTAVSVTSKAQQKKKRKNQKKNQKKNHWWFHGQRNALKKNKKVKGKATWPTYSAK